MARPSPATCSLMRTTSICQLRRAAARAAARRAVSGSPRMSSSPSRRMSKAMSATGCALSMRSTSLRIREWIRPWSRWNPAGRPLASSATISPSRSTGAFSFAPHFAERLDDRRKLRGLLVAEPRPDAHARRRPWPARRDQRADAVVLRLVDQPRARQRRLRQRRQHRPHLRRVLSPAHPHDRTRAHGFRFGLHDEHDASTTQRQRCGCRAVASSCRSASRRLAVGSGNGNKCADLRKHLFAGHDVPIIQ